MRVFNLTRLSSGVLLALLTMAALANSVTADAQTSFRSFQMALWDFSGPPVNPLPDFDVNSNTAINANADIKTFGPLDGQPGGRAIVVGWNQNVPLTSATFNWSGIVAVEIDEPYNSLSHDPCEDAGSATAARNIDALLAQRAAELKSFAPRARFWVNFTIDTVGWMRDLNCQTQGLTFDNSYIDVVSIDMYDANFSASVESYYETLIARSPKPDQQLALIPGLFVSPSNQLQYLQGFFDYANYENQTCNLPFGPRGETGIYDGCPIWIVAGFLAYDTPTQKNGKIYTGMFDYNAVSTAAAWQAEVALPLSPLLQHARAKVLVPVLKALQH